ncbi:MAG: hypothetical protein ACLQF0_09315 [Dissulfurispiraceae bacterium]
MNKSTAILKWLLLAGAVYFLAVAIVHMLRIKIPMLFIYYDLPSYGYQDRIISFLSFGWSVFLFMASIDPARNRDAVKAILIAGFAAIAGLNIINSVTDFQALSRDNNPSVFRKEVLALSVYEAALIFFYFLAKRGKIKRGRTSDFN